MKFNDLTKQYQKIKRNINSSITRVLKKSNFILGEQVTTLEQELRKYTGSKYCICVGNGSDALLISLVALDIKPGDEVITPAFSYISAAESIAFLGATPIFVDVDPDTYNININDLKKKITKKTKAIIPVSLFGQIPDFDEINNLANKNNLTVIEDAAQSFGATYKNKKSCNLSEIACTSFFPSKSLGCYGDGGAIFTKSKKLFDKIIKLRNHGQDKKYSHKFIGINSRLDTLQAAILLEKLKILDWEIKKKQKIAKQFITEINKRFPKIKTPDVSENCNHIFSQFTIQVNKRDKYIDSFVRSSIPYAIHYPKIIPQQEAFKKFCKNYTFPVSLKLSRTVMSLPIHPYLTKNDISRIINALDIN